VGSSRGNLNWSGSCEGSSWNTVGDVHGLQIRISNAFTRGSEYCTHRQNTIFKLAFPYKSFRFRFYWHRTRRELLVARIRTVGHHNISSYHARVRNSIVIEADWLKFKTNDEFIHLDLVHLHSSAAASLQRSVGYNQGRNSFHQSLYPSCSQKVPVVIQRVRE
jgi:hypothetical protein